jgi:hypothetical protein
VARLTFSLLYTIARESIQAIHALQGLLRAMDEPRRNKLLKGYPEFYDVINRLEHCPEVSRRVAGPLCPHCGNLGKCLDDDGKMDRCSCTAASMVE